MSVSATLIIPIPSKESVPVVVGVGEPARLDPELIGGGNGGVLVYGPDELAWL